MPGVVSYPIPLFANVPIQPQYYQPSRFVITAIALGQTTIVTTSVNHNYVISQQCRLIIPSSFGSRILNEQTAYVISVPSANQVELNISSVGADAFITSTATTQAQILAIGDISSGPTNINIIPEILTIPGSFQNISPL